MKFVLALVALALVATVNAAPSPAFDGDLDLIQKSLVDIATAAANLNVMETNLGDLALKKDKIEAAELALETATATTGYTAGSYP